MMSFVQFFLFFAVHSRVHSHRKVDGRKAETDAAVIKLFMFWPHFYSLVLSQDINKNLFVQRMTTLELAALHAEGSTAYQQIYSNLHAR